MVLSYIGATRISVGDSLLAVAEVVPAAIVDEQRERVS